MSDEITDIVPSDRNTVNSKPSQPTYEVGYMKPPKRGQFQAGQSGNPKGRPKGAKCARTILTGLMAEMQIIMVDGQHKSVSRLEAMMMQLTNKALKGDLKAQSTILAMLDENEQAGQIREQTRFNTETDKQVMQNLQERYRNEDPSP